jgi:site-specific DNA-methyltransferase (adenine-specific)
VTPRNRVLVGDALTRLRELQSGSIDCVITSPPYFGLRNYGVTGQLGAEAHIDGWVASLRAVCRELMRVLAPHGSLWLNLGDGYSRSAGDGAAFKSLLLGPERVALGLIEDGWLLRNKVIWAKTNPMPSSVRDRLSCTHEFLYLFTKQPRYFFDLDAIRVPIRSRRPARPHARPSLPVSARGRLAGGGQTGLVELARTGRAGHPLGKNPGDVWSLGTSSYRGGHFATFPPKLVRRPLLASCPAFVCAGCGRPAPGERACECRARRQPGLVLDPFFGTGTVGQVAREHGRDWLGIELNPVYVGLAETRLGVGLQGPS